MTESNVDILLVEDRSEDAELAMMALKHNRLVNNIHWVKDGEEALEYVFAEGRYSHRNIEQRPGLILLDLDLPKIGGMEVLKKIKGDERVKHIPIVILTTSDEEENIKLANDLHVNSYLVKPVKFDEFAESIKSLGLFWVLFNQKPY